MKQINYKKLIIPNIPYVFFVYLFDKVGQAVRLAPGADISEKILTARIFPKRYSISHRDFPKRFQMPCRAFTRWICLLALWARWLSV